MKKLAVIGSNGTLGSDLVRYFRDKFIVTEINRENYSTHVGKSFDILINANGNSKRFWANQNQLEDFFVSTVSVYRSVFDFHFDTYIYISSSDVYENHAGPESTRENINIDPKNLEPYGFHKFISEIIVKRNCPKFMILRCSMMLGNKLKKGPIYDILHAKPLFIDPESRIQLITTKAVAEIIQKLLENNLTNQTLNVGGSGIFLFKGLSKYFNKVKFHRNTQLQIYEMNVNEIRSFIHH